MQKFCRAFALFALAWLLPALAFAQAGGYATLQGKVTNAETGEPLPGAHVFIAKSMKGTVAGADGSYRLEQVPLGALRLYVSNVGMVDAYKDLVLREVRVQTVDFALTPAVLETPEIVLEGELDRKWQRRLEKFTARFVGETPNAAETKIVNPEVLDFEERLGTLTARASAPLVIENRALGYRIQYFLKDFKAEGGRTMYDGEPLYEELEPDSPEQAIMWEANRKKAFYGSFRHFALALWQGKLDEHGFLLYHRPSGGPGGGRGVMAGMAGQGGFGSSGRFPIKPEDFVKEGASPLEKTLDFPGHVEILFTAEKEDPAYLKWGERVTGGQPKLQTSWIALEKGPAGLDYKGDPLDPYGITFYGYLAFERVADDVPKEYRPKAN